MVLAARWARLERYARWRGRLHLDDLPGDVLGYLAAEFLAPADVQSLATAFVGRPPDFYSRADLHAMPLELRTQWLYHTMHAKYAARLVDFARECYPAAYELCMDLHVHVDWSPLAAVCPMPRGTPLGAPRGAPDPPPAPPPPPVAVMRWRPPGVGLEVHDAAMLASAMRACRRGTPAVSLRAYAVTHDGVMFPHPVRVTCYPFLPHFALGGAAPLPPARPFPPPRTPRRARRPRQCHRPASPPPTRPP